MTNKRLNALVLDPAKQEGLRHSTFAHGRESNRSAVRPTHGRDSNPRTYETRQPRSVKKSMLLSFGHVGRAKSLRGSVAKKDRHPETYIQSPLPLDHYPRTAGRPPGSPPLAGGYKREGELRMQVTIQRFLHPHRGGRDSPGRRRSPQREFQKACRFGQRPKVFRSKD